MLSLSILNPWSDTDVGVEAEVAIYRVEEKRVEEGFRKHGIRDP